MVFEICCTLYCWKTIQKLQLRITLLVEIIQHYGVMEEELRFSHLKKYTFFVITDFFLDPHHPNLTAFLEILVPFSEPHRLHNRQLKKFNKKDPSSQRQMTIFLPLPLFIICKIFSAHQSK